MATLSELRTLAEGEIARAGHFTAEVATHLNGWANEAVQWLAREYPALPWLEWEATLAATILNQTTLVMPDDFNQLIEIKNTTNAHVLERNDLLFLEQGDPNTWSVGFTEFYCPSPVAPPARPAPGQALPAQDVPEYAIYRPPEVGTVFYIRYYRTPQAIGAHDDDVPDMPVIMHGYVKDYMVMKALELSEDVATSRMVYARVMRFLNKHIVTLVNRKERERCGKVKTVSDRRLSKPAYFRWL